MSWGIMLLTVCIFAVLGDVWVDSSGVACLRAEVVQEFDATRLAILIFLEWVDDPNLTEVHSRGDGCRVWVAWDELDILNTTSVGNGDSVGDLAVGEVPQAEGVCSLDTERWLQHSDWDDKVRSEHDIAFEVNGQAVRRELLAKDVQGLEESVYCHYSQYTTGVLTPSTSSGH